MAVLTATTTMKATQQNIDEIRYKTYAEYERVKTELARAQKQYVDLNTTYEKQKKHATAVEASLQDTRKANVSTQIELKELRLKLRAAEYERSQASGKQSELADVKKALQAAESRRKEDMREKDKKIADLEKLLAHEKKKRETLDGRVTEMRNKDDDRKNLHSEVKQTKVALETLQTQASAKEEQLLARLQQHQDLVSTVAQEYGRLIASAVPDAVHAETKHEADCLRLRCWRLERKLANSEAQAVELVSLVRYVSEQNSLLSLELTDARAQFSSLEPSLDNNDVPIQEEGEFDAGLYQQQHILDLEQELQSADQHMRVASQCSKIYHEWSRELTGTTLYLDDTLRTAAEKSTLQQKEISRVQESCEDLRRQRERSEHFKAELQRTLDTECLAKQRLTIALQGLKLAASKSQVEITKLTDELAAAERYKDAYSMLYAEAEALVARNELAETEAEQLSRLNAQIIGHTNPAQKIMYLERLRDELAETKQKLLLSVRSHKAASQANEGLRSELEVYRSVSGSSKSMTSVTRVPRRPLLDLNGQTPDSTKSTSTTRSSRSGMSTGSLSLKTNSNDDLLDGLSRLDEISGAWSIEDEEAALQVYLPGDMTVDEIL